MLKTQELENPNSCLNRARDDEPVFVLLGRDVTAPDTIRRWANERIHAGKNLPGDQQIKEALALAESMEQFRDALQPARA